MLTPDQFLRLNARDGNSNSMSAPENYGNAATSQGSGDGDSAYASLESQIVSHPAPPDPNADLQIDVRHTI